MKEKYIGVHGAEYEESGDFDIKVTKPDGKVFYIPRRDFANIQMIDVCESNLFLKKQEIVAIEIELTRLNSNKSKVKQ